MAKGEYVRRDKIFKDNRNPRKPFFRKLTDEEIDEIANKEWKEQVVKTSPIPSVDKRLKNLTGPKTKEGKKRALANLRPARKATPQEVQVSEAVAETALDVPTGMLPCLLDKAEETFVAERQAMYFNDFELNESADRSLLNLVLYHEIMLRRAMIYQSEHPSKDISKQIKVCQENLISALKSLGMLREQRVGMKIDVKQSVADLAEKVSLEIAKSERLKKEEIELMKKKGLVIDAEFSEAAEDDSDG